MGSVFELDTSKKGVVCCVGGLTMKIELDCNSYFTKFIPDLLDKLHKVSEREDLRLADSAKYITRLPATDSDEEWLDEEGFRFPQLEQAAERLDTLYDQMSAEDGERDSKFQTLPTVEKALSKILTEAAKKHNFPALRKVASEDNILEKALVAATYLKVRQGVSDILEKGKNYQKQEFDKFMEDWPFARIREESNIRQQYEEVRVGTKTFEEFVGMRAHYEWDADEPTMEPEFETRHYSKMESRKTGLEFEDLRPKWEDVTTWGKSHAVEEANNRLAKEVKEYLAANLDKSLRSLLEPVAPFFKVAEESIPIKKEPSPRDDAVDWFHREFFPGMLVKLSMLNLDGKLVGHFSKLPASDDYNDWRNGQKVQGYVLNNCMKAIDEQYGKCRKRRLDDDYSYTEDLALQLLEAEVREILAHRDFSLGFAECEVEEAIVQALSVEAYNSLLPDLKTVDDCWEEAFSFFKDMYWNDYALSPDYQDSVNYNRKIKEGIADHAKDCARPYFEAKLNGLVKKTVQEKVVPHAEAFVAGYYKEVKK